MDKKKAYEIIDSLVNGTHKDFIDNNTLKFKDQTQLALALALNTLKQKIDSNNQNSEISVKENEKIESNEDEDNLYKLIHEVNSLNYLDENLLIRLKELRSNLSNNLPPYMVFKDSTLELLARNLPSTKDEMLRIKGVGEKSLRKYGDKFLKEIKKYLDEKNEHKHVGEDVFDDNEINKNKIYSEIPCHDCNKKIIEKERVEKTKNIIIRCIKCQEAFEKKNTKHPIHPVDKGIAGTREDNIATQTNQWNAMRKNYET